MRGDSKTLATIRSEVCNAMLVWLSGGLLTILLAAVAVRAPFISAPALVGSAVFVLLAILFAAFRRKLPYGARAGLIVVMSFGAGLAKMVMFGAPYGFLDLALMVVMTAALFGERAGIGAAAGCLASLAAVYFGFSLGLISPPVGEPPPLAASTWILGIIMLAVTTFGPLIVVARLAHHVDLERQRAQEASDAKSNFLATMSHELRTPLNAIIGFSEALGLDYAGPPGSTRYREYANDIHHSARHLLDIVDDLLNIARLDAHQVTAAIEPLDVAAELARAMATVEGVAAKGGLTLRLDLGTPLPRVIADPKLFQQIMINLLSNATKFTPAGGRVTIAAHAEGDRVRIEVIDTGIGIPAEEIPHLGQPFRQAKHPMVRVEGGAGLGLALAKSFTELQQGTFAIRSAVGVGTTMVVTLPAERDRIAP